MLSCPLFALLISSMRSVTARHASVVSSSISAASLPPPQERPRRRSTELPLAILRSGHLYSTGVHKIVREVTINGVKAVDLLCWDHVKGRPCNCDGTRAHLFSGTCGTAIAAALGACDQCTRADCCKPHASDVLSELCSWYNEVYGPSLLGVVPVTAPQHSEELSRSMETSMGAAGLPPRCTVPTHIVRERLERHSESTPAVGRLLSEPFFEDMLGRDAERRLLSQRGCVKEISEAYSTADELRRLTCGLGLEARFTAGGKGLCILDVCSGKGLSAALHSRLLPRARVVMLDANPRLELVTSSPPAPPLAVGTSPAPPDSLILHYALQFHVAAQPNLHFSELDIFSRDAAAAMHELAGAGTARDDDRPQGGVVDDGEVCIAVGMHLCGALSPRLIALCAHLESVRAFALSPCCIKGSLGDLVKRASRSSGRDNYQVLLETLEALCVSEVNGRAAVSLRRDEQMASPRNGFVSAIKTWP